MHIIPAELTHSEGDFISQLQTLTPYFSHFHIDVADGKFVPNTTLQIEDISAALFTLPHEELDKLSFDFHLMVENIDIELGKLQSLAEKIKIETVFMHASVLNPHKWTEVQTAGKFSTGIVLNPEDSVDVLSQTYDLSSIQFIQLMTVHPGFQGGAFVPEMLNKIEQLGMQHYRNKIYLDGAINNHTLPLIKPHQNHLSAVNIGSYLVHSKDVGGTVDSIRLILG